MHRQHPPRRIPKIQFRVLIIGRANAGKTSILQRVCDTTDSPIIYQGGEQVTLHPSADRGEHTVHDELVFSNHKAYIFHDSRAIESGSTEELAILREFILRKCGKRRLQDRLHAIWYCIPMDNQRPQLDLRFFKGICPDQNVPVIAVFTKYDQFRRNIRFHIDDFGSPDDDVSQVTEEFFQEHYLRPLGDDVRFVRLEKMHMQDMRCDELIETTAAALNDETTARMLLAVQRSNLELSVKAALIRVHSRIGNSRIGNDSEVKHIVRQCLFPFPYIWLDSGEGELEELRERRESLGRRLLNRLESLERALLELETEPFEMMFLELEFRELEELLANVMSLPTITNHTTTNLDRNHLALAVIILLKHATFLRLSNLSLESAFTRAELDYREANIDSKIRLHLTASSSQEHSVHLFASFIMATDLTVGLNSSWDQYSRAS